MRKHVWKILNAQRDLLSSQAISAIETAIQSLREAVAAKVEKNALLLEMENLEKTANKWLKPYPNATMRENVEVLLVAVAVAMGIRTFFLQPFKIPTGSMQPTLYGITHENLIDRPDVTIPNPVVCFFLYWYNGVQYKHIVARADGELVSIGAPKRFLLFNLFQDFQVGDESYRIWFPPDRFMERAGLQYPNNGLAVRRQFRKGDDIIKMKCFSGDHLFVDRMTYNFRRPRRGEIIVFNTEGIEGMQREHWGQFYIKRLVALGGEHVRIGDDRHLVIDGKRLDSSTPHFEFVYSFNGPPKESTYSGHLNGTVAGDIRMAPLFPDEKTEVVVRRNHYMVMGDNTVNSSDSRYWGDFSREQVIGRSFFVYWPIGSQDGRGSRFGWGHR